MRISYIILCFCAIFALSSCRTSKTATPTTPPSANTMHDTDRIDTAAILASHLSDVASSYKSWNDVEMPIDLELISPKDFSISGRATMVKDKSIYISIRVFGFEAANIYIDNDSIHATYKLNKLYIAENTAKLLKGYAVTVSDLQDLLLGRAFILGKGTIKNSNDIDLALSSSTWTATPKCDIKGVEYKYTFNTNDNALKLLTVLIQGANPVMCDYSDNIDTEAGAIAQMLEISANVKKQQLKASIKWNADKAKWNSGATPKWKAPKGYNRVNVEALLKAFN